jgi:hypothetical protein
MTEWSNAFSALGSGIVVGWIALPALLKLASRARHAAPALYHRTLIWALMLAVALSLVPLGRELSSSLRPGSWWQVASPSQLLVVFDWAEPPLSAAARSAWPERLLRVFTLVIGAFWALIVAGGSAGMIRAQFELERRCRRKLAAPVGVQVQARAIAAQLGIRAPAIVVSSVFELPFSVGVYRPRVILPESLLARASEAELGFTLRHELTHVARGAPCPRCSG